jgi:predicted negative regulator of RcsB-dependent stress response
VDDLQSEKEQLEEIRAWWSEYGRYVIAGVLIAVGLLLGFNQYQSSKTAAQMEASQLFESLADHVFDGDLDSAELVANELATNYANTPYAAQSKLAMARLYMDKNRDQDAADALNELLAMRSNKALKYVGRLRLARVLLYQDKAQEVLDLLEDREGEAFSGLYEETRGDAHAALGQFGEAADAYRTALADTSQTVNRGVVQMKLIDLPDVQPAAADESVPEPNLVTEPEAEPVIEDEAGAQE